MSYGSEYLFDNAYEIEQSQRRWEALCIEAEMEAHHGLWRCKDGRVMNVTEMEISHIQNCIKMLERHNSPFKKSYIKMFNAELERRTNDGTVVCTTGHRHSHLHNYIGCCKKR